jgi:hypothetical protein
MAGDEPPAAAVEPTTDMDQDLVEILDGGSGDTSPTYL